MCDFISQNSPLSFLEQIANTVFVDSAKWYVGAHWGLWWKRKNLQTKTGKNPSGKMHFDAWMHLTELYVSVQWSVASTVFLKSVMGYYLAQWSLRWQKKYPQLKTRKNPALKLLGDKWIHPTELHLCFLEQSINTVFEEPEKGYFGWHWSLRW